MPNSYKYVGDDIQNRVFDETTNTLKTTASQGSPPWQVQSNSANIATETTLDAFRNETQVNFDALNNLVAAESTLQAIKDTDGIKKITDALPTGTNTIGAVNQGTQKSSGAGWRNTEYGPSGLPNAYFNILGVFEVPTTVIGDPTTGSPWNFVNGAGLVHGVSAADAVDVAYPLKIGANVSNYQPTTSNVVSGGRTAMSAAGDIGNVASNLRGEVIEGVNPFFFTLDNVSTTYSTSTNLTSTAKECWNYRQATFSYELTKTGSPTDILFEIEVSLNNGSTYTVLQNDFLGALRESAASIGSGIKKSVTFPIACSHIQVKATSTVPSGTIVAANLVLYLRN
jgi:hypothetical protein